MTFSMKSLGLSPEPTYYRVIEAIAGRGFGFNVGAVIGTKPGEALPDALAPVVEPFTGTVPADALVLDEDAWATTTNPPAADKPAPKPLDLPSAKRYLNMLDPALWDEALALGLPRPTIRRGHRTPHGETLEFLWQQADLDNWRERIRRVSMVLR